MEKAWLDQAGAAPLTPVMAFGLDGLTLGAGTVLAPMEDLNDADIRGEARLCALLSAAYRQPIAPQAIRYIRRGAASWRDGDKAMAAMHLAMTGLLPLRNVKDAARRLFMADALMKAGVEPDTILRVLDLGGEDALTLYDSAEPRHPAGSGPVSGRWTRDGAAAGAQPRHRAKPSGSGRGPGSVAPIKPTQAAPASAGQPSLADVASSIGARALEALRTPFEQPSDAPVLAPQGRTAPLRASPMGSPMDLRGQGHAAARTASRAAARAVIREGVALLENPETFAALASLAARVSGPATFFSVLLTPSNRTSPDEIPLVDHPGMRLERGIGERLWRFVYKDKNGVQYRVIQKDDGIIRTADGRVVGRMDVKRNTVFVRPALDAIVADPAGDGGRTKAGVGVEDDQPNLCPKPVKDYYGGGPLSTARLHEDRVKLFLNPDLPTPSGMGYSLANPEAKRKRVIFDDCQRKTGMMAEAKGPTFSKFLDQKLRQYAKNKNKNMLKTISQKLIKQARLQVGAARLAGNRPIKWFCHDQATADFVRARFKEYEHGLENIMFGVVP